MPLDDQESSYSTVTALIYVFNLIVGTGALALPGAVAKAGWFPGTVLVCALGLVSYITVTFIIETLAVANAVGRQRTLQVQYEEEEDRPLLDNDSDFFEIKEKFEISELATALLSRPSRVVVVVCLITYLFGDLSIYCAVIARTLAHTTCSRPANASCNATVPDTELCWEDLLLTRLDMYRIYVGIVVFVLCPLVFMNLQKTKWLQMVTTCMRWAAFGVMIVWSIQKLAVQGPQGTHVFANVYALPTLFGTCVYSFMCQHSIPGLVQPISNKVSFTKVLPFTYGQIGIFYIFLSLTAVWTFSKVEDLYTLNFWSDTCSDGNGSVVFLDYFLALFPVFTLGTSFPIIAITLRNNLRDFLPNSWWVSTGLPFVTCLIPASLALLVPDLQLLVGFVGSYAGAALQYLAPALLVSAARSRCPATPDNPYRSPFRAKGWVLAVYGWTAVSLFLITLNYITTFVSWSK